MIADPLFRMGDAIPGTAYRVRRNLGKGGMALTFLVQDAILNRVVVLKILRPELVDTPAAALMIREARALDALGAVSSGFLRVFHFGEMPVDLGKGRPSMLPYYSMERIDGPTLRRMIHENARRGTPIALDPALQIAYEVATALQKAHDLGIVHRDIKPENIMVHMRAEEVMVKIIDLGVHSWQRQYHDENDLKFRGTLEYAAPEHLLENEVGPPVDVYATALVLYELLALRPPFAGSQHEIVHGHLHGKPPPVSEARAQTTGARDIPPALDDFIRRALAKDPRARIFGGVDRGPKSQVALEFAQEAESIKKTITNGRTADMLYGEAVRVRDPNNTSSGGRAPSSKRRIVADDQPADAHATTAPVDTIPTAASPSHSSSDAPLASAPPAPDVAAHRVVVLGEVTPSAPADPRMAAYEQPKFTETLPQGWPALAAVAEAVPAAAPSRGPDRTEETDMAWLRAYEHRPAPEEQSTGQILEALWEDNVYQESQVDAAEARPVPTAEASAAPAWPVPSAQRSEPPPPTPLRRASSRSEGSVVITWIVVAVLVAIALMGIAFVQHWWPFAR